MCARAHVPFCGRSCAYIFDICFYAPDRTVEGGWGGLVVRAVAHSFFRFGQSALRCWTRARSCSCSSSDIVRLASDGSVSFFLLVRHGTRIGLEMFRMPENASLLRVSAVAVQTQVHVRIIVTINGVRRAPPHTTTQQQQQKGTGQTRDARCPHVHHLWSFVGCFWGGGWGWGGRGCGVRASVLARTRERNA